MEGIIKKKMRDKFFGFITPSNGGKDVFFHANDVADKGFEGLDEEMKVSFEMGDSPKGPKAVNVTPIA